MNFDDIEAEAAEAHERRIKRCRSCNAMIIWFKDALGRNVPVNEGTVEAGEHELDDTRHTSHVKTCPKR